MQKQKTNQRKQWINLLINIIIPVLILTKLTKEAFLGPVRGLVIALSFPLVYGIWELRKEKKYNIYSIIGLVSILLTGGIGLLELPTKWIAIKEAAVPAVLGIAILVSIWTKHPFVRGLVSMMLDMDAVDDALEKKDNTDELKVRLYKLEVMLSYRIAFSFAVSATLNYLLAKWIVVSPAGTEAFVNEIGKMTGLSFPVIVLPVTIILMVVLMYVVHQLHKMTGLEYEEMMKKS